MTEDTETIDKDGTRHGVMHFRLGGNMGKQYTEMLREKAWYDCKRADAILEGMDILHGISRAQVESILDGKKKLITADDKIYMKVVKDDWTPPDYKKMEKEIHEVLQFVGFERGNVERYKRRGSFYNWSDMLPESERLQLDSEASAVLEIMNWNIWKAHSMSRSLKSYAEYLMKLNSKRFVANAELIDTKFKLGMGTPEDSQDMQVIGKTLDVLEELEKDAITNIATSDMPEEMKRRLILVAKGQSDARRFGVNITEDKEFKFDTGWLNPKGVYYGCQLGQHIEMGEKLAKTYYADAISGNYERTLETHGWVKVSGGQWLSPVSTKLTKAQLDSIFDWCGKHGMELSWNGRKMTYNELLESEGNA
jgi:hypothetical protein